MTTIRQEAIECTRSEEVETLKPAAPISPGGMAIEAYLRFYYGKEADEKLHNKKKPELLEMYQKAVQGIVGEAEAATSVIEL